MKYLGLCEFHKTICEVFLSTYTNGQPAIILLDAEDRAPFTTASVCLVHYPIKPDHTAINNYSENEGILEALIAAEIVEDTRERAIHGHELIPIVKIKETFK